MKRRKTSKLGNVYLKGITIDLEMEYKDFEGWHNQGVIKYKIGRFGRTKLVEYVTMNNRYKIAFLESRYRNCEIPQNREDRENLLLMAYGKIGEMQYFLDLKKEFLIQQQEREEEERQRLEEEKRKQEEEEKKRIALGEQISIDKYLLNK